MRLKNPIDWSKRVSLFFVSVTIGSDFKRNPNPIVIEIVLCWFDFMQFFFFFLRLLLLFHSVSLASSGCFFSSFHSFFLFFPVYRSCCMALAFLPYKFRYLSVCILVARICIRMQYDQRWRALHILFCCSLLLFCFRLQKRQIANGSSSASLNEPKILSLFYVK